jgi:hypothetical protein
MKYFFSVLIFVGLALQVSVIQALIRGPLRRFIVLFGYAIILLLTTVVDATAYFNGPQFRAVFREYYWIDEVLRKTSLFVLVLSLIANALANTERRARILALLVLASLIVAGLSAWLLYDPTVRPSHWMTEIVRNLAFFASILNLIFWFAMIRARKTPAELLLISGGLGIESTGEAIAQSVRPFVTRTTIWIPNVFIVLTHFVCLIIWASALRRARRNDARAVSDNRRAGVTSV